MNPENPVSVNEQNTERDGASKIDVCVIGDSLATLASALEFAELGLRVHVVLPETGPVDHPRAPGRDPEGVIAGFLDRVAAPILAGGPVNADAIATHVPPKHVLMRGTKGSWHRVPEPSVFGIPAVTLSTDSLAFLPAGAAVRAYLDRVKPLLTVGKTHDLGQLVRSRLGAGLFDSLVVPLVRERFGAPDLEVAVAAPGLNEALSRAGSLSGAALAYSERNTVRETGVVPAGGWARLRETLLDRLGHYGATCTTAEVDVQSRADGEWWVTGEALELSARALVADPGTALPESVAAALAGLLPRRWRGHAEVELARTGITDGELSVDGPDSPGSPLAQAAADTPADAVQTVVLPSGAVWSIRVSRAVRGGAIAHVSGPATPEEAAVDMVTADALAALALAGLTPAGAPVCSVRAAPYLALAERDAAYALLADEREAQANLLPVGRVLHGDDLAVTVEDALTASVALRRRLAGIAD